MKINTKQTVKNLRGEEYKIENKALTVGDVFSEVLAADQTAGKMKLYVLAKRFVDEKEVDLDAADLLLVKNAVETSKTYGGNNIILGSVLLVLEG